MSLNVKLERLYDRIELINGIGDPGSGKLCLMSLVAFLAGEAHSDTPRAASPLIREFAVPINDGMDRSMRQRLKPFAPRILGTSDGRDPERAALLYRAIVEEVFPQALKDLQQVSDRAPQVQGGGHLFIMWPQLKGEPPAAVHAVLRQAGRSDTRLIDTMGKMVGAYAGGTYGGMAFEAGRLILYAARNAPSGSREAWYWNKAIDILDRLCDVGAEGRSHGGRAVAPEMAVERVAG
jgi:hypothetical protein